MEIWFIIAALSLVTVATLFWGGRRMAGATQTDSAEAQVAIYKDQLAEIETDLARGMIEPVEAEAHRTEVARRLLAASGTKEGPQGAGRRRFVLVPALLVPLLAFAVYARIGAPALPDMPQAERLASAEKNNDLEALVYKVEKHLAKNPDDATGWEVVLPTYQAMGRFNDAAQAYRRLIAIKGPTAELYANLSEMLMFAGNGLMPAEGAAAAREALKLDPQHSKARYYEALSLHQEGKNAEALARFEALFADAPADAPWREAVVKQIAEVKAGKAQPSGPTQEQVEAAGSMSAGDQQAMIRGMVDGLAAKLEADPKNLEGWLRLIRARMVLKEPDIAKSSLDKARAIFDGDQGALGQLAALAKELDLK